jgi:hypothetical protein
MVMRILDQFIHHVGYRACLTNERKVLFFGFFKVGSGTNKEPDCVFCTEVEASELLELFVLAQPFLCWELVALAASLQVDTRFSTIPCIRCRLEFTPELKTVVLSRLFPALCQVISRAIKTTAAAFVAQLRFPIGNTTSEPVAHGSFSHTKTVCDLFESEAGFAQFNQLLIAVRSLCLVSQVSTSRRGSVWRRPLGLLVRF